jgi:hypothetical protein
MQNGLNQDVSAFLVSYHSPETCRQAQRFWVKAQEGKWKYTNW